MRCALLLGGFSFGGGVRVFLGKTLDTAGSINELLFASEEWVAVRADLDLQHVALDGRTSGEIVTAGAVHRDGMIIGVNSGFHEAPFLSRPVCTAARQGLGTTAASLGREAILNHTRSVKFLQTEIGIRVREQGEGR